MAFLDPPYGLGLVPLALERLWGAGVLARDALVVAEVGAGEDWVPRAPVLADRAHGAARVLVFGGSSEANEQNIQGAYDPVVLRNKRGDGAL